MIKVLFVCLGNICRSPMAEGVFQYMVNQAGLSDQILVDSAGTARYHEGEPAHNGTRRILAQHNIPYNGRARKIARDDFYTFDYILAMDRDNLVTLQSSKPADATPIMKLFLEYADGVSDQEVPDPYYNGKFEEVYQLIENASRGLLTAIRKAHNL